MKGYAISQEVDNASVPKIPELIESIYFKQSKRIELKKKIEASHQLIHEHHIETQSLIAPRKREMQNNPIAALKK